MDGVYPVPRQVAAAHALRAEPYARPARGTAQHVPRPRGLGHARLGLSIDVALRLLGALWGAGGRGRKKGVRQEGVSGRVPIRYGMKASVSDVHGVSPCLGY